MFCFVTVIYCVLIRQIFVNGDDVQDGLVPVSWSFDDVGRSILHFLKIENDMTWYDISNLVIYYKIEQV